MNFKPKVKPKNTRKNFRWMVSVLDLSSNQVVYKQKNMDYDDYARVMDELRLKFR
jgi:hypothetical protein